MSDHPTQSYSPASTRAEIPDFELLRPVGQGGFGQVWLARNRTTDQLRAVKLIPLGVTDRADPAGRELTSLIRLEAVSQQRHPHLAAIHHVGRTPHYLFYVMDLADDISGRPGTADVAYQPATLGLRLEQGLLPPEDCLRYAKQLLSALACLHQADMAHRDVKPANCLFIGGQLQLADFGLLSRNNRTISRVGTEKYMPPDGRMDARADVYAAGLVIYEMLTGLPVERFPSLGDRGPEIGQDPVLSLLNQLVLRACEPDPDHRFQEAREMLDVLEMPLPQVGAEPVWSRRTLLAMAATFGVTAVLAGTGFWLSARDMVLPGAAEAAGSASTVVQVNFLTEPWEATIYMDGQLLVQPDGRPYTTPCTVPALPAGVHRFVFRHPSQIDLQTEPIDVRKNREIVARWASDPLTQ